MVSNFRTAKCLPTMIYKVSVSVLIVFVVAWTLLPFYWLFVTSIASEAQMRELFVQLWPKRVLFYRYKILLNIEPGSETGRLFPGIAGLARRFLPVLRNTLFVSAVGTILALAIAVPAAYGFARFKFRGRSLLFGFILGSRIIPPAVTIVPLFVIVSRLGMVDKLITIILLDSALALPLIMWMLWSYFDAVRRELEEAARIDGCSTAKVILKVLLPVAAPGLMAAISVSFITIWNEFFYALIFTDSVASVTLPKLIASFGSEYGGLDYGLISAAAVLTVLPPAFLTLALQRYIVSGLTAGALK